MFPLRNTKLLFVVPLNVIGCPTYNTGSDWNVTSSMLPDVATLPSYAVIIGDILPDSTIKLPVNSTLPVLVPDAK